MQQTLNVNITVVTAPVLSNSFTLGPWNLAQVINVSCVPALSGGVSPFTWSCSGLPSGLSINTSTGLITGTVGGSTGVFVATLGVTDNNGVSATSININITVATGNGVGNASGNSTAAAVGSTAGAPFLPAHFSNVYTGMFSTTANFAPGVPNFCSALTNYNTTSGNWSNPAIWNTGIVPVSSDLVVIKLGTTVNVDISNAVANSVVIAGTLNFNPGSGMTVVNMVVVGGKSTDPMGSLIIGPDDAGFIPFSSPVTITFADVAPTDPEQYGTGLTSLGNIIIYGEIKTPFVQVSTELTAGQTTISLATAVTGWLAGDTLVIPDTHQLTQLEQSGRAGSYVNQTEEVTIQSVAIDNLSVILTAPLVHAHLGGHNIDGSLFTGRSYTLLSSGAGSVGKALPHIANLNRSVVFKSANPAGNRGHIFVSGYGDIDMNYGTSYKLGRTLGNTNESNTTFNVNGSVKALGTNQYSRLALAHNGIVGPFPLQNTWQFQAIGWCIWGDDVPGATFHRWGQATYNAWWGLIQYCVAYKCGSSGFGTKFYQDTNNVFDNNYSCRIFGNGQRATESGGSGFYFFGVNNTVTNNIACNVVGGTYSYSYTLDSINTALTFKLPKFQGADPTVAGQFNNVILMNQPIGTWDNNQGYGATCNYLSYYNLGAGDGSGTQSVSLGGGLMTNALSWNVFQYPIFAYDTYKFTIDGFTYLGDPSATNFTVGMWFGDYATSKCVFNNLLITACLRGMFTPFHTSAGFINGANNNTFGQTSFFPSLTVSNSRFVCTTGIQIMPANSIEGTNNWNLPPMQFIFTNCTYSHPPSQPLQSIQLYYATAESGGAVGGFNLMTPTQVIINNHNSSNINYNLYWSQQAASFVPPSTIWAAGYFSGILQYTPGPYGQPDPPGNVSTVQTITVTNKSGILVLRFEGQNTPTSGGGALAWNATAGQVQTALTALSTIGASNVSVSSPSAGVFVVTFIGSLGSLPQPPIVTVAPSTAATIAITVNGTIPGPAPGNLTNAQCWTTYSPPTSNANQPLYIGSGPGIALFGAVMPSTAVPGPTDILNAYVTTF